MCFEIFMPDVRETEISLTMFFPGKKKHKITLLSHDFKVYNLKSWVTIIDDKFLIWGLLWKLNRMMFWKNSFFEKKCDLTVKSDLLSVMFWQNWLSSGFWKKARKTICFDLCFGRKNHVKDLRLKESIWMKEET